MVGINQGKRDHPGPLPRRIAAPGREASVKGMALGLNPHGASLWFGVWIDPEGDGRGLE